MNQTQAYFFIDGIRANTKEKRQMRRHVMKGKNAGKTLHRQSRFKRQVVRSSAKPTWDERAEGGRFSSGLSPLSNKFGNGSFVFWLPVHVSPESLEIIHDFFIFSSERIYSPDLGLSMEEAKALWLPTMLGDEATYQCSMDMMHTCNQLVLHGCDNINALCCISRTLDHVKKRLESDAALSDASIYMLVTLIMQEQIRRQSSAVQIHADGLRKMVDLRGGIDKMTNIGLTIKICKTDIVLALQQGEHPTYFRDALPDAEKTLKERGFCLDRASITFPHGCRSLDARLSEVFVDIMALCRLLNHHIRPRSIDLITYQDILLSIFYKLLQFRSLNESRTTFDQHSALHFGLVLFTMSVLLHHGTRSIVDFHLASACLKDIVDSAIDEVDDDLILWLHLVGGIWTSESEWIRQRTSVLAQRLAISEWTAARARLNGLPWIEVLHDKAGREFWQNMAHGNG